jgi:hypothetical protein
MDEKLSPFVIHKPQNGAGVAGIINHRPQATGQSKPLHLDVDLSLTNIQTSNTDVHPLLHFNLGTCYVQTLILISHFATLFPTIGHWLLI